jgi:hypothetical protein
VTAYLQLVPRSSEGGSKHPLRHTPRWRSALSAAARDKAPIATVYMCSVVTHSSNNSDRLLVVMETESASCEVRARSLTWHCYFKGRHISRQSAHTICFRKFLTKFSSVCIEWEQRSSVHKQPISVPDRLPLCTSSQSLPRTDFLCAQAADLCPGQTSSVHKQLISAPDRLPLCRSS